MSDQNNKDDQKKNQQIQHNLLHNHKRKISQLQNKAYFFEGQIDPLYIENIKLKDQLTTQNRTILLSTDMLRNLLPQSSDKNRQLKIQMAPLQQICSMIKEDWSRMQTYINQCQQTIKYKQLKIDSLQILYRGTVNKYQNTLKQLIEKHRQQKNKLQSQNCELNSLLKRQKQLKAKQLKQLQQSYKERLKCLDQLTKQFYLYKHQANLKTKSYQSTIERLKSQMQSNLLEFQQSKKNLKQIYQKLMEDKIAELNDGFDLLLRNKQQEKLQLYRKLEQLEEQHKKKMDLKKFQISALQNKNNQLRQDIGKYQHELYQNQMKIDKLEKDINQSQKFIKKMTENMNNLKNQIDTLSKSHQQQLNKLNSQKKDLQNQLQNLTTNSSQMIKSLQKSIEKLTQQIKQNQNKISQLKQTIKTNQVKFFKKFQQQQETWLKKFQQQENIRKQMQKSFDQTCKKYQRQIQEKEQRIAIMKIQNQQQINLLVKRNSQQLKRLNEMRQRQINQLRRQNQQELAKCQKKYEQKIQFMQQQHNKYIHSLIEEQNIRYKQLQTIINEKQNQLQQQRQKINQMQMDHQKLVNQKQDLMKNYQKIISNITQQLSNAQIKNKVLEMQINYQKEKFLKELQKQKLEFQKELEQANLRHLRKLSQYQNQCEKEKSLLKQQNGLDILDQQYKTLIDSLTKQYQEKLQAMRKMRREQLLEQEKMFTADLVKIQRKLNNNICSNNDMMLNGQNQFSEILQKKRQQQISYLQDRIGRDKKQIIEKQQKILEVQLQLHKCKDQLSKIDKIIQQKVKMRQQQLEQQKQMYFKQCMGMIDRQKIQCNIKIKAIQHERIQFSKKMYEQFQQMQRLHQNQINQFLRKYMELQKLFQQRPSRAEDLSKIRSLIEQKAKMVRQIEQCQIKVSNANKIVKYLNLQLENYKDVYQIFGNKEQSGKKIEVQKESPLSYFINSIKKAETKPEQNQSIIAYQKYIERNKTEGQVKDFQLFPSLNQKNSIYLNEEEQYCQQQQKYLDSSHRSNLLRHKRSNTLGKSSLDKSSDILKNAEHFIDSLQKQHKKVVEIPEKGIHESYRKKIRNKFRKATHIIHDKQIKITNKQLIKFQKV